VPESGEPVSLKRTQIDPARLSSGVVDALTSEGQALPLGRYIVSLADANNRVFRAVEFRVGAAPRVRPKPPAATRLEKVYFDEYSLTYPNTFTPQPIAAPVKGMFLRRGAPFGMMFAVLSDPKSDTVLPQARAIVDVMLARLDAGATHVTKTEVRDVPASQFPPGMLVGKTMEITLTRGMSAQATFYSKNVEGRRVLFGYMAVTGHGVPAEYERLLTTDPEALAEDFLRMVSSFKGGTPWGARTPGEP
jgi:hypothetical protein